MDEAGSWPSDSSARFPDPSLSVAASPSARKAAAVKAEARVPSESAAFASPAKSAVAGFSPRPAIAPPAESTTAETTWSRCSAGSCASSSEAPRDAPVVVNRIVPRIATPSAEPTCLDVDCVPEP